MFLNLIVACKANDIDPYHIYNLEFDDLKDKEISTFEKNEKGVFISGKEFSYSYEYNDSTGLKRRIVAEFDKECAVNCFLKWKYQLPKEVIYGKGFYPIDSIRITVYKGKNSNLNNINQKTIRYDYGNKYGTIFPGLTGVIEDSAQVFLHPPRDYGFVITEFSPFPWFKKDEDEWSGSITDISQEFIDESKLEFLKNHGNITIPTHYRIIGMEKLKTKKWKNLECKVVEGKGVLEDRESKITFYYNEEKGFVKIIYHNIDKSELILNLESINENSNN